VRMGEHDARKNPEFSKELGMNSYVKDYAVKEIILHPEYDDGTKQNDIALIRLSDDVKVTRKNVLGSSLNFNLKIRND